MLEPGAGIGPAPVEGAGFWYASLAHARLGPSQTVKSYVEAGA